MSRICDEIRIIFRGPSERLFIAYKPFGWHVCSPSGKKKLDDSLSSVIGAKLGIPEDSIKFPSKLRINQRGLVIGTTDEPMYSQITKMIDNRQCFKTYTCLLRSTLSDFLNKNLNLKLETDNFNENNSHLRGTIHFNLRKLEKKSQSDPDFRVDSQPGPNTYSLKFTLTSLYRILQNLENGLELGNFQPNTFSLLELEINDKVVDKHVQDILDQLDINVVKKSDKTLNESYKAIELSKVQLPHPILTNRRITSSVTLPLENWLRYLENP